MGRRLTAKQGKFIDGVAAGMTYSDAYRQAGYAVDKMTVKEIAINANRVARLPNISPIIEEHKAELADKDIWKREDALNALKDIVYEAQKNRKKESKYNAAAENVAIRAIEQANKMCGYNEPEKIEIMQGEAFRVVIDGIQDDE